MPVLYASPIGSPCASPAGVGLTVLFCAEGFPSESAFEQAVMDLWERLIDIPALEELEEPSGNCAVYTWYQSGSPFGVQATGGVLSADVDLLVAGLATVQLAQPSGGNPHDVLADGPWPHHGATPYATTLLVVLVDPAGPVGRGEWLCVERPEVPYHVVVGSGPDDAAAVAIAVGRLYGLAAETESSADVPTFARRRSALNLLAASVDDRLAGSISDPWRPWRDSSAFDVESIVVAGVDARRPEPTLMAVPRTGPIAPELVARGFGAVGMWIVASQS